MDTNKDTYQDSISEKKKKPYLQVDQDEEEEAEDALSFCDLPIYSSKQDQTFPSSPPSSSSDQHLFEFFTQNGTHSSTNYPVSNIIFCGKLIPFKEPIANTNQILEADKEQKGPNRWVFRWNLKIFGRKSALDKKSNNGAKSRCVLGSKYGFSVRRVSTVTWPAKPRWQLLMFGLARFPAAEMEMSEIRSRQRRRSPSALFRLRPGGGDEEVRRVRGLCVLIRSFGCGGRLRHDDASAVVNA